MSHFHLLVNLWRIVLVTAILSTTPAGCGPAPDTGSKTAGPNLNVLATSTLLADVAQNVAGDRLSVAALLPAGVDPHSFEATPGDVIKVARSQVLIVNGAGLEEFLEKLLQNASGSRRVIVASAGLTPRIPKPGEGLDADEHPEGDPHFWLDPNLVVRYVENIRDGLSQADPAGAALYAANANAYIAQLRDLDRWTREQVQAIPEKSRLLVTNHESFGYFADRYGFQIVGTIIPSVSTSASPSAQQLARLIDQIKASGVKAIFLETGANPQLAQQVARETGVKVVTDLYTHATTDAGGPAPTYIDLMRHNIRTIVAALR